MTKLCAEIDFKNRNNICLCFPWLFFSECTAHVIPADNTHLGNRTCTTCAACHGSSLLWSINAAAGHWSLYFYCKGIIKNTLVVVRVCMLMLSFFFNLCRILYGHQGTRDKSGYCHVRIFFFRFMCTIMREKRRSLLEYTSVFTSPNP